MTSENSVARHARAMGVEHPAAIRVVGELAERGENYMAAEVGALTGVGGTGDGGGYLPMPGVRFASMGVLEAYPTGATGVVVEATDEQVSIRMDDDLRLIVLLPSDDIGGEQPGEGRPRNVGCAFWHRFEVTRP